MASNSIVINSFKKVPAMDFLNFELDELEKERTGTPRLCRAQSLDGRSCSIEYPLTKNRSCCPMNRSGSQPGAQLSALKGHSNDLNLACWMGQHKLFLEKMPLRKICLPGTHDSGAYSGALTDRAIPGHHLPKWICDLLNSRYLSCLMYPGFRVGITWSVTQHIDIATQLCLGVRYFDMRVALHEGAFHLVHTFLGPKLEPILEKISLFLEENPEEIVLLDFNHIHCFTSLQDHRSFQQVVRRWLGSKMAGTEMGLDVTYGQLLEKQKQVIAFYVPCGDFPDAIEVAMQAGFWPHQPAVVQSPWPRAESLSDLLPKLTDLASGMAKQQEHKGTFFVLQGVVTPSATSITKGLCWGPQSLEELCREARPRLQEFLSSAAMLCPCIVIADFMPAELVELLVRSNFKRENSKV